jgi:hypothetical protein
MLPIVDNIVGWFGTVGVFEALRRRAVEGGSYRVRVSLTRLCLWLISLGIFDKEFATTTAGSTAEHSAIPPELFTAKTPLGTYQGNDRSDRILFTSAGIHHHCAAVDGRRSAGMVAASNKSGLISRGLYRRADRRFGCTARRSICLGPGCRSRRRVWCRIGPMARAQPPRHQRRDGWGDDIECQHHLLAVAGKSPPTRTA